MCRRSVCVCVSARRSVDETHPPHHPPPRATAPAHERGAQVCVHRRAERAAASVEYACARANATRDGEACVEKPDGSLSPKPRTLRILSRRVLQQVRAHRTRVVGHAFLFSVEPG